MQAHKQEGALLILDKLGLNSKQQQRRRRPQEEKDAEELAPSKRGHEKEQDMRVNSLMLVQ